MLAEAFCVSLSHHCCYLGYKQAPKLNKKYSNTEKGRPFPAGKRILVQRTYSILHLAEKSQTQPKLNLIFLYSLNALSVKTSKPTFQTSRPNMTQTSFVNIRVGLSAFHAVAYRLNRKMLGELSLAHRLTSLLA